jgi:hypothetical protein
MGAGEQVLGPDPGWLEFLTVADILEEREKRG